VKQYVIAAVLVVTITMLFIGYRLFGDPAEPLSTASVELPAEKPASGFFFDGVPVEQSDQSAEYSEPPAWPEQEGDPPEPVMSADLRAESMRQAFLEGDERTPPLASRDPEQQRELPTAEELADPALYQQYEARQQMNVRQSFARAARNRISELEQQLQQAEQMGGDPDQLREGREKLERLQQQYDQTVAEMPELAESLDSETPEQTEEQGFVRQQPDDETGE
jgi:archaellum component FlaC